MLYGSLLRVTLRIGMALFRKIFWLAVFLISTLFFVVLFENGPEQFSKNFSKRVDELRKFVDEQVHPPKKEQT